jgi:hypothetical protein
MTTKNNQQEAEAESQQQTPEISSEKIKQDEAYPRLSKYRCFE